MKRWILAILTAIMLCGACAQADYQAGQAAEDAGLIELAFELWEEATAQGDAEAAYQLGRRYYNGTYGEADYAKAKEYFLIAADLGNSKAMRAIGIMYKDGKGVEQDIEKALEWHMKAAALGNGLSMNNIGRIYKEQGDYAAAMEWYLKANESGYDGLNGIQCTDIGNLYYAGQGVEQDYEQAMEWYLLGVQNGSAAGAYNIGLMYCNGESVEKDYAVAAQWFEKALEINPDYLSALERLESIYQETEYSLTPDDEEATVDLPYTGVLYTELEYVPGLGKEVYVWSTEEYRFVPFDDGTAEIIGYTRYIDSEAGISLTIPDELGGCRVTAIGESAFEGCGAKEIVLPKDVKHIRKYAFHGTEAERIVLPEGLETIGDCAFYRSVYLNQIDIPSGVTYIGTEAFAYTDLREITLPETELTLGSNPFANIDYLDDVYFSQQHPTLVKYDPQQILSRDDHRVVSVINWGEGEDYSVTFSPETREIADCAFKGCINLYEIHVPGTVERIGDHAFFESYLIEATIAEGVESIGETAFCYCPLLKSVTIPASVTFIGEDAFSESDSVILTVEAGSYAEEYARKNEIPYVGATYDELDTDEIYARAKKL